MNKVPEKLEDPGKFLIPCALQELDRTSALADSRASINLLPHSIYKQLRLGALTPTRMTLELANRSITHPMGIAIRLVAVPLLIFIPSDDSFPSSSPVKTSDNIEKFTDELALPNSLPPGDDVSILKKNLQEDTFRIISNPIFEFDESFKSSNVNPLFEEKDKDVEIKSSTFVTLTSPEEKDSIPPGIDLNLPTTLEVLSSNPTFPTLTGKK
ncbi:reverse transcriptase domain-containing protein, partial [Tanacetum coccineum]